jgi:hypothetical protein
MCTLLVLLYCYLPSSSFEDWWLLTTFSSTKTLEGKFGKTLYCTDTWSSSRLRCRRILYVILQEQKCVLWLAKCDICSSWMSRPFLQAQCQLFARYRVPLIEEHAHGCLGLVLSTGIVFYLTIHITLHLDHLCDGRRHIAHCWPFLLWVGGRTFLLRVLQCVLLRFCPPYLRKLLDMFMFGWQTSMFVACQSFSRASFFSDIYTALIGSLVTDFLG